ncbi:MAG: bacteriohemerythrin [Macromonas sp.]
MNTTASSNTEASSATDTTQATPPAVPALEWSESLVVGNARMDDTHAEFVDMVARLRAAPAAEQLALYRELLAHTVEHFEREDRWMQATGFAADNCHSGQHATVLDTMRKVESHYLEGDTDILIRMAEALAEWFPQHTQNMDAGLAMHMNNLGFDTATETLTDPSRTVPEASMSSCGSVSCS